MCLRNFIAIAVLALTAGCKHGPKTVLHSAPLELKEGWKNHDTKAGFSIAGPYNWTLNPPSSIPPISLGSDPNQPEPPEAPDVLSPQEQSRQEANGILLKLYDKNVRPTPGEAPTCMWVKKIDSSGSLADTADDVKHGLGSDVEVTNVNLPIGPATELKKVTKTPGGDELTDIVFVLVNGDDAFKFVFEATNNDEPITTVAQPMMETVRFKA